VVTFSPVKHAILSNWDFEIIFFEVTVATGRWFSLGISVSSTNKSENHDITEILLKVALNTINQPNQPTIVTFMTCRLQS
jgi:hypothetical protein